MKDPIDDMIKSLTGGKRQIECACGFLCKAHLQVLDTLVKDHHQVKRFATAIRRFIDSRPKETIDHVSDMPFAKLREEISMFDGDIK